METVKLRALIYSISSTDEWN